MDSMMDCDRGPHIGRMVPLRAAEALPA
jgi:hypothetical protein